MSVKSKSSAEIKRTRRSSKRRYNGRSDEEVLEHFSDITFGASYFPLDSHRTRTTELDSEPDRSDPAWKVSTTKVCKDLPETAEVEFEEEPKISLWEEIMIEYEEKRLEYDNIVELSKPYEPVLPICSKLSAVQYLNKYIFPLLCPILEETLVKAEEAECLSIQKCRFSGLDYISELLWNRNPLHPCRRKNPRGIFDIPFVVIWLHQNPRPIYPLSWLWSKEQAIIVLQTYIRRYFVCKERECSEMRQFWKILKTEKEEKNEAELLQRLERIEAEINDVIDALIANSVFETQRKIRGCPCHKNKCSCVCKCNKSCKCCTCNKTTEHPVEHCTCSKP